MAAVVAGDRTEPQIRTHLGVPVRGTLARLVCADLLCMKVVDAVWHYLPTKAGRAAIK
ncbi:hypothetical protein AB0I61_17485 [Polymorphospora rubra]|uniref:hypothetical protein n=1 Tax=Polymorphospora rubra TaxID=338584 RepID=UPI0033D04334